MAAFLAIGFASGTVLGALAPEGLPWISLPMLVGALGAGWLLLALDRRPPGALGFPLGASAVPGSLLGLALGAAVAAAAVGAVALAGGLRFTPDAGTWGGWLVAAGSTLWLLALPAAAEEALLRGYPFQALAEAWGPAWALVVTSVLFSLFHAANPGVSVLGLVSVAAAGLFLGAVYLRTRSLWWASGAHLGWNWAHGFGADLPVSGYDLVDTPLLDARLAGPAWLSGGAFGLEGSALATAVVLAAAAWTWRTGRLGRAGPPEARPAADPPGGSGVHS